MNRSRVAARVLPAGPLRMEYRQLGAGDPLPTTALCAVTFGARSPPTPEVAAPCGLRIHVNLPILESTGLWELWHTNGEVQTGHEGPVRFAAGGHFLAGLVEIDERAAGGLEEAAREAYAAISRFTLHSGHRHLLRMFNNFSRINAGDGDAERYKLFCRGRAAGFKGLADLSWPAATAIGRQDDNPVLQVYWLAGHEPGRALENPRQVSAFHYPRQYGPSPPSFSRAMRIAGGMMISGTASVVGHASHHADDLPAQLDEILRNLASLRQASGSGALAQSGRGTVLKIYLRQPAAAGFVASYLRERLPTQIQFMVLAADICRRELLVEIDAAHFSRAS